MLRCARKIILIAILLTLGGSLYGWWQRDDLLGWYYFKQLSQADGAEREAWVDRLVGLDEAVVPRALTCLCHDDKGLVSGGEEVLVGLVRKWQDARTTNILNDMLAKWRTFSSAGKNSVLNVARVALEEKGEDSPVGFLCTLARDLLQSGMDEPTAERARLQLALVLVRLEPGEIPRALVVTLAEHGLGCADFDVRALALRLFLQPPLNQDAELLARVVPFLKDAAAEVRRVALLAVGSNPDLVAEDDLLPLLHDADAEVCQFCEVALRGRGLPDRHIILARLIGDDRPTARLEVLQFLHDAHDLDHSVWLRRLSQDPAAAVRAAAIRAASRHNVAGLRDRLLDMAQNDDSATVRQLAAYYLTPRR